MGPLTVEELPPGLDYHILKIYSNNNGRFLLLKCKCEEATCIIINCNASTPQHRKDQENFINFVNSHLKKFENQNIALEGDYNFYMDRDLDKQKNMTRSNNNSLFRQEIVGLLESINLVDPWHIRYPTSRRYTWHSRGMLSKPDYLFISEHLLIDINKVSIQTKLYSDHSIVNLKLANNKINRGRSFWKFNNELLHDKEYMNLIKKTILDNKMNYNHYTDKGFILELIKLKIRSTTISNCMKKREKYQLQRKLVKRNQLNRNQA